MASNDITEGPGNQKQSCLRELFKEQSCRYIVPRSLTHQLGTQSSGQATLSVVKWLPRTPCGGTGVVSRDPGPKMEWHQSIRVTTTC